MYRFSYKKVETNIARADDDDSPAMRKRPLKLSRLRLSVLKSNKRENMVRKMDLRIQIQKLDMLGQSWYTCGNTWKEGALCKGVHQLLQLLHPCYLSTGPHRILQPRLKLIYC